MSRQQRPLMPEDLKAIITLVQHGLATQKQLAKFFDISPSTLSHLIKREIYGNDLAQ